LNRSSDTRRIFIRILKEKDGMVSIGFNWLRAGNSVGLIKGGNFLNSWPTVSFSRTTLIHGVSEQFTP
jgi:hypothetical protein